MAIRRRLLSEEERERSEQRTRVYEGYPRAEFQGYVRRFGIVYAEFMSAGMLKIAGRAPDVKGTPSAHFEFMTLEKLEGYIAGYKKHNLSTEHLEKIRADWPTGAKAHKLPSHRLQPL